MQKLSEAANNPGGGVMISKEAILNSDVLVWYKGSGDIETNFFLLFTVVFW